MQSEEVTFIGKRWGSTTNLAFAAVTGATGVAALLLDWPVVGIVLLLSAATMVATSLRTALFPRSRYLHLDSSGFEVGLRQNRDRIKWDDVAEFRWSSQNDGPVIEVLYVQEYARQSCVVGDQRFAGRIFDRYNAPLTDVLEKLREMQQRYGHAATPSGLGHATTPSAQKRTA
jgi:hypothetical protein